MLQQHQATRCKNHATRHGLSVRPFSSRHSAISSRGHKARTAVAAAAAQPAAVITGCSTGIGKETALLLAEKGWRVFAGARSESDLQQLGLLHEGITPIELDVTSQASISCAQQQVQAAVADSGLQLLVNNAGVGFVAPVEFMPLDSFRQVMDVNLFGVLATSQAFIPLLRQGQQKGRVVNIGSVAGHLALPLWSAYCTSKYALEGLSDCLRFELAPQGVAVVLVKPGPVKTPIWQKSRTKSENAETFEAAQAVYGTLIQVMQEEGKKNEEAGIPVTEVAQLIYEAATTPNPPARYHIGDKAALTHWVKRLLPDGVWEGMIGKYLEGAYKRNSSLL